MAMTYPQSDRQTTPVDPPAEEAGDQSLAALELQRLCEEAQRRPPAELPRAYTEALARVRFALD